MKDIIIGASAGVIFGLSFILVTVKASDYDDYDYCQVNCVLVKDCLYSCHK